jgi:hypothetical protein
MYKSLFLCVVFLLGFGVLSVSAQVITHPEKGSPERAALLNILRGPVETELKQKIVFVVHYLNVQGNWAFLSGDLQTPDGGRRRISISRNTVGTKKTARWTATFRRCSRKRAGNGRS